LEGLPAADPAPTPEVPATAKPLNVALAGAGLGMAAALPVCFAVTEGYMPMGHALYVSLLIGLLLGATGLLTVGLIALTRQGVDSLRRAAARRTPRQAAGAKLAFD
jgi:hypothetical protein